MKHTAILRILLFGSLWGFSEVFLGEALYAAQIRGASVPLNVVAVVLLTVAWVRLPQLGSAIAIACCAGLYKLAAISFSVAGTPLFLCHLLGIGAMGVAYEGVFGLLRARAARRRTNRVSTPAVALGAAAATYLAYALFALGITFVFRYEHWAAAGWPRVLRHVGVHGSLAAVAAMVLAPVARWLAEGLRSTASGLAAGHPRLAWGGACLLAAALWFVGWVGSP
jgi:hypothetical protein